jgi:hypothetical protein
VVAAVPGPAAPTRAAAVLTVFAATYLLVTPGTVVDWERFSHDVLFVVNQYRVKGQGGYTVEAGWPHFVRILDFLAFRLASPYQILSVSVSAAALVGGAIAWRSNWRTAVLLTAAPVLYTSYMASNRVLIVRNLLILVPFVAVLVALAVDALARLSRRVVVRAVIPLAAAALLALNWPTFLHTASSLQDLDPEFWRRAVVTYVEAHPDRRFAVSPRVAALLFDAPGSQLVTVHSPEHSDAYLYVLTEHRPTIANRRNVYRVVAGPDDVDLDYYPTWLGLKRIVVVDGPVAGFLTGLRFGGGDMSR